MTKGMALIKARDLLGPSASVFAEGQMVYIGVGSIPVSNPVAKAIVVGHTWEQALKLAADSTAAREWHDEQVAIANKAAAANKSLAATAVEVAKKKYQEYMGRQANEAQVNAAAREQKIVDDEAWQAARVEAYEEALYRTQQRARENANV